MNDTAKTGTDTLVPVDTGDGVMNMAEENFIMEAVSAGMMEVQHGNLAQQKSSSAEVKRFAWRMVTDHTKANNELKSTTHDRRLF